MPTKKTTPAKKADAPKKETATEKAKRLQAELDSFKADVADVLDEYKDNICSMGKSDIFPKMAKHGVKLPGVAGTITVTLNLTDDELAAPFIDYEGGSYGGPDLSSAGADAITDGLSKAKIELEGVTLNFSIDDVQFEQW
jgi:hypothetical protein